MPYRAQIAVVAAISLATFGCGGGQRGGEAPSCTDAAGGAARSLRTVRPDVAEADVDPGPEFASVCAVDQWTEVSRRCFAQALTPELARVCAARLTEPQRAHARAVQTEIINRATATLQARRGGITTNIAECDDYLSVIDHVMKCNKVAQTARDSVLRTRDEMAESWSQIENFDGVSYVVAREAVAANCRQAAEFLQQSLRVLGC